MVWQSGIDGAALRAGAFTYRWMEYRMECSMSSFRAPVNMDGNYVARFQSESKARSAPYRRKVRICANVKTRLSKSVSSLNMLANSEE